MIYARVILLFFIYAFLGWCTEVAFAACKNGRFVNRGFLNGPVCPIYGFGMVGVAVLLEPLKDNLLLLYLGSAVITTVIEYITGLLLERIFHAKWWDYSNMPLNIGGYVCLLFSLIWGAMCVAIVKFVHPVIAGMVEHLRGNACNYSQACVETDEARIHGGRNSQSVRQYRQAHF